jgi:serine/threonine protein kinase
MWTGSIKRCWHYSLWSEARKHSFMYEVGFLHEDDHKELYAAAISSWDFMYPCFVHSSVKQAEIKIIDFGSACMENRTVYSYIQVYIHCWKKAFIMINPVVFLINWYLNYMSYLFLLQSRYYRSPEVLLGYQYPYPWS